MGVIFKNEKFAVLRPTKECLGHSLSMFNASILLRELEPAHRHSKCHALNFTVYIVVYWYVYY